MSSTESQRAQIMFHLYTKLFNVVCDARDTGPSEGQKLDKWFNIEVGDSELFSKESRERYKAIGGDPPTLEVQVLLAVPELGHNQVLVHLPPNSSRVRIQPVPRFVLLETFVLEVQPGPAAAIPLATIYKHCIVLFRSLYSLLRVLPACKLHRRLRRRGASLGITLRVGGGRDGDVLSLANAESRRHVFPRLPHPMGSFTLSTTYLAHPAFQLDELESVLSSRFLSQDQRPFTPTLARAASPSPPRQLPSSIAKQAPALRTATPLRQPDSSTSSLSDSQPQPAPRYPFPFKSNTITTTTSPSSIPHTTTTSPSSIPHTTTTSPSSIPHTTTSSPSSIPLPDARPRPIPLHVRQSSLPRPDDPASPTATRKRYSSSFGHRYTPSPSSSPSLSPSVPPPSSSAPRPPYRARPDHDEISAFVHDIDIRKPLVGRMTPSTHEPSPPPEPHPTTGLDSPRNPCSSPPGRVLTTAAEIDARLSAMNDVFLHSLQGLGSASAGAPSPSRAIGPGQQQHVRQGSQELIGRMDMGVDMDAFDPDTTTRFAF